MVWFKVDDNLSFHHKTVAAGNAAMGLWVRAGSWCAQNLTDGFVPDHMLARMGTSSQVSKLVAVGLWERKEGGIEFHQWSIRQPLRGEVDAERDAARARMKSIRAAKKGTKKTEPQVSGLGSPEVPRTGQSAFGNPDPTRPDPSLVPNGTSSAPKRASQLPDDFEPNQRNREIAEERGLNLDSVVAQFADHHRAKGSTMKDWHLALNTWLRRERPGQAVARPRHLQHASEIETPPDGLSEAEYSEWMRRQRERRGA